MDSKPNSLEDKAKIVCPACGSLIDDNEVFCPVCNAPISLLSNTDPLQSIYAQGHLFRKSVETRPKPIVLIGTWIIFFPMFIGGGLVIYTIWSDGFGGGAGNFLWFWLSVAIMGFSGYLIYHVTKNYYDFPQKNNDLDADP